MTSNASALVIRQPWKHVAIAAGCRVLDLDYEAGEGIDRCKWNVTLSGPIVGIDFRW